MYRPDDYPIEVGTRNTQVFVEQAKERPGYGMIIDAQVGTQISPSNQEHTHEVIVALLYTLR